MGDELLAVLTDAQRQHLQVLLERKELQRMHLVDYAALIVPELAVAQMPWSVQISRSLVSRHCRLDVYRPCTGPMLSSERANGHVGHACSRQRRRCAITS